MHCNFRLHECVMWPNLIADNVNIADIMPHGPTHVVNPNDIMCSSHNMHALASQASLCNYDVPLTY